MFSSPTRQTRTTGIFLWMAELATWGLLAVSLLGRLGKFFYGFELLSHFAVQYLAISIGLVIFWSIRKSRLGWIAATTLILNAWLVMPWLGRTTTTAAGDLRLMHTNILFSNVDYESVKRDILREKADLVLVAEATPDFYRFFRNELRERYPYHYMVYAKAHCYIIVGSRTPLRVNHEAVPENRMIQVHTTIRGKEIAVVSVHPKTPIYHEWFKIRNQRIGKAFEAASKETVPTILAGDFNVSVFSPVYQSLVSSSGLQASRKGFGILPTFPNDGLTLLMIPIDHVFTNQGFQTVGFHTVDMTGSDHKAVVVDLKFR